MTNYEADKFMLEHPEVAVKVAESAWVIDGERWPWVVWNEVSKDKDRSWGSTRETAISEYKRIHHPEKPPYRYHPHVVKRALADSAKYRKIVETFREVGTKIELKDLFDYKWIVRSIRSILADDIRPSYCNECGQSLGTKKET